MRKKILCYFLGLILAGIASATWALAQPSGGMGPGGRMGPAGMGGAGGFQGKFQQIKRTQMGPALGVNQQTVDRLLQIDARYQPVRQQLIRDMKVDFRRLQQLMSQPSPPDQEVQAVLTSMKQKKQQMQDLQTRQGEEEDALLTPVQQARYIMYLRGLVKEARNIKGGPGGESEPMMPSSPREIPVSRPAR